MDREAVGKALAEAIKRQRGYADFFDWPDKSVKEWGIVQSFVDELHRDNGTMVAGGKQHPGGANHAPDFQLHTTDGKVWGVEITELVSRDAICETKRGKSVFATWPDEELLSAFQELIERKDRPDHVRGGPYDRYILLVHVDEAMLTTERLSAVLAPLTFKTRLVDDIYVLLSYDPRVQRDPLLKFTARRV